MNEPEEIKIVSVSDPLENFIPKHEFSEKVKNGLATATVIILPFERKFGDKKELFFEQGTMDLYNFFILKKDLQNKVEILCDDENYQEIVKYDNTLILPVLLLLNDFLKETAIDLFVEYIKEYVSSKIGIGKIKINIINQRDKNCYDEIKYEGSINNFSKALSGYLDYKKKKNN